jgi:hypothetical protein
VHGRAHAPRADVRSGLLGGVLVAKKGPLRRRPRNRAGAAPAQCGAPTECGAAAT